MDYVHGHDQIFHVNFHKAAIRVDSYYQGNLPTTVRWLERGVSLPPKNLLIVTNRTETSRPSSWHPHLYHVSHYEEASELS